MKYTSEKLSYLSPSLRESEINVRKPLAISIGGGSEGYTKRYPTSSFEDLDEDEEEIEW